MRKTLVFKNIPESDDEKKNGWEGTEDALVHKIMEVDDKDREEDFYYQLLERCHRGAPNRNNKPRDIICQFYSWKDSQEILQAFAKKNVQDRSFKIYCNQKYGPKTSAHRNLAMIERKRLLGTGDIAKGYVAYPAKLS